MCSLLVLVGSGWAWASYKSLTTNVASGYALPAVGAVGAVPNNDGKDENILLIGNDSRAGATPAELAELSTQNDPGARTDTIMLLHIPADGSRASLISFPRDSYVKQPNGGMDRINAAYSTAYDQGIANGESEAQAESRGVLATSETVSQLTGRYIDHYLQVSLLGFYRISVALQGITVCLNAAEKDHYSGIDLPAGITANLQGKQALAFVRQRHGLTSDLDRIKRQQYFLAAAFAKAKSADILLNPLKVQDLLNAAGTSLIADDQLNLLDLLTQTRDLAAGNINAFTIPTHSGSPIDGADVLRVDPAEVKAYVDSVIVPPAPTPTTPSAAPTVAPSTVTVAVANASGRSHAAADASDVLRRLGFVVSSVGDAERPSVVTTVTYPTGDEAQARAVAGAVTGAALQQSATATGVTLTLGSDGVTVGGTGPTTPVPTPTANVNGGALGCID